MSMKTSGLENDSIRSMWCTRYTSVNNSIMEEKSLSSAFNLMQPSIKRVELLLGDLVNFNYKMNLSLLYIFYGTSCLFPGTPPSL